MNEVLYEGRYAKLVRDEQTGHEILQADDSVAVLVYITDWDKVVLIRQERPAMRHGRNETGIILEVPAGRRDRDVNIHDLVIAELREEIGAEVHLNEIISVNHGASLALSPGILTEKMSLFYVEIPSSRLDKNKQEFGLKEESESTIREIISVDELQKVIFNDMKTFALAQWFLLRYMKQEVLKITRRD